MYVVNLVDSAFAGLLSIQPAVRSAIPLQDGSVCKVPRVVAMGCRLLSNWERAQSMIIHLG